MHPLLTIVTAGAGVLIAALAIPMIRRRVPPNGLYGLRVPATFADEWVWYEANAQSGRDLFWLGVLLTLLAILLPFAWGVTGYLAWAAIAGIGALSMCAVGWRRANRLLRARRGDASR